MLSDLEIKRKLQALNFDTANSNRPFNPELQINASSVDLRICSKYFLPVTSEEVKLDAADFGASTIGLFKEMNCLSNEYITIRPNKFILARTYEKFSVPDDCSAITHARSSFARLGLDINSTCQYINPGWSGHMPLIIHNRTSWPISIKPFDLIVQVSFNQLIGNVETPYQDQTPTPNYLLDNGGPSKIWINLCRKGFEESDFKLSTDDRSKMIEFGKKLNQPSLKSFLKFLPQSSNIETGSDLIKNLIDQQKTTKTMSRVFFPTLVSLLCFGILWLLDLTNIFFVVGTVSAAFVLLLTNLYLNRFDSVDKLQSYWNEVSHD